jgi:hypothetical protein
MDDDSNPFRAWAAEFSRVIWIVGYWSIALWFMFWADPSSKALPPIDMPNWGRGFWYMVVGSAICLLAAVFGYYGLPDQRAADRSVVERSLAGLRALLFLIPPVVFACAFAIGATMFLGLFPYQGVEYNVLYAGAVFAWHHFLWLPPDFAQNLFPTQTVIVHTDATTAVLALMCRVAAIVTLIAAVVPALGRRLDASHVDVR